MLLEKYFDIRKKLDNNLVGILSFQNPLPLPFPVGLNLRLSGNYVKT
jgi:hypothetical protein